MIIIVQEPFDRILGTAQKILLVERADQEGSVQRSPAGFLFGFRHLNNRCLFADRFEKRHEKFPRSQTVAALKQAHTVIPLRRLHETLEKLFHPVVGNFHADVRSELTSAQIGKEGCIIAVPVETGSKLADFYIPVRIHEIIQPG